MLTIQPKGESYADHITAHPYVRVIDMINHSVNIPELVYLTPSTHEKIARYTISSKDVYISIAGTIGQVGAIPDSIDGANLTENAAKIVLNKEAPVDRDYLIWYLSFGLSTLFQTNFFRLFFRYCTGV